MLLPCTDVENARTIEDVPLEELESSRVHVGGTDGIPRTGDDLRRVDVGVLRDKVLAVDLQHDPRHARVDDKAVVGQVRDELFLGRWARYHHAHAASC